MNSLTLANIALRHSETFTWGWKQAKVKTRQAEEIRQTYPLGDQAGEQESKWETLKIGGDHLYRDSQRQTDTYLRKPTKGGTCYLERKVPHSELNLWPVK